MLDLASRQARPLCSIGVLIQSLPKVDMPYHPSLLPHPLHVTFFFFSGSLGQGCCVVTAARYWESMRTKDVTLQTMIQGFDGIYFPGDPWTCEGPGRLWEWAAFVPPLSNS